MPASSTTRRQSSPLVAVGPDRPGRPAVEHEAGDLAGHVAATGRARRRGPRQERAEPGRRPGDHERPVGGVAVEHHRLVAGEEPRAARRKRVAWSDALDRVAGCRSPRARRAAARAVGEVGRAAPTSSRRTAASVGDDRGRQQRAGQRHAAHLLERRPRCRRVPSPRPPCASGTSRPVQPRSTIVSHTSAVKPRRVVDHRPHVGRGRASASTVRTHLARRPPDRR